MPSTVTGSGAWYSSILTPRARRSATAAWMSGTIQAIWVWVSEVPTVPPLRAEYDADRQAQRWFG